MFGYGLVGPSMVWLALIWTWNGLDLAYPYFPVGGWLVELELGRALQFGFDLGLCNYGGAGSHSLLVF